MRLRAIVLDGIGYGEARFAPLRLDFTDGQAPTDTVVWLDNGGGKTSLSSLVFTVLRPARREFIAKLRDPDYQLEHYVLAKDTGHVALVWDVTPPGALVSHQLVTGQVLEWKDRTVSSDVSRLKRTSYGFVARPGVIDIDSLPIEGPDGQRRTLTAFTAALRDLGATDPRLQMAVEADHSRWLRWLEDHHLDPFLLRQQVLMNGEEGGATRLLTFSDVWDFADLLVRMLVDETDLATLTRTVTNLRDKYARQAGDRAELALCTAAVPVLGSISRAETRRATARTSLEDAAADATRLRNSLVAGIGQSMSDAAARDELADQHGRAARGFATELSRAENRRTQARWEAAKLRADGAEERERTLRSRAASAATESRAWQLVGTVLHVDAADARTTEINLRLSADQDAFGAAQERAVQAAARYGAKLAATRDEQTALAATHERAAEAANEEADEHREAHDQLATEVSDAERQIAQAADDAAEAERALTELETDGTVASGESASAARARLEEQAAAASRRVEDAKGAASRADRDKDDVQRELPKLAADLALLSTRRSDDVDKLERLTDHRDQLVADPVLVELAGGAATLPRDIDRIVRAAEEQAGELETEAAAADSELQAVAARLERLDDSGVEVSADVAVTVDTLVAAGIPAVAGWRYLADAIDSSEGRTGLLASDPAAVAGVVLPASGTDLDQVRATVADIVPADPVTIVPAGDLGADGADGRIVLAPSSERYDPDVAAELSEQLADRVEELTGDRDGRNDAASNRREIASKLRRFADAGGRDLEELAAAVAEARTAIDDLAARQRQLAEDLKDAAARRSAADAEREAAETAASQTGAALARLAGAERAAATAARSAGAGRDADRKLPGLRTRKAGRAEDERTARERASKLSRLAGEARGRASTIVDIASEEAVTLPDTTPAGAADLPHREQLLAELRDARDEVRQLTPDAQLQAELKEIERSTRDGREELRAAPPATLTLARELAASAEASSVTARSDATARAEQAASGLNGQHAVAVEDAKRLRTSADELAPSGRTRHADLSGFPFETADDADALAERFQTVVDNMRRSRDEAAGKATAATDEANGLRARAGLLGAHAGRLSDQLELTATALGREPAEPGPAAAFQGPAADIVTDVDLHAATLGEHRGELTAADGEAEAAAARAHELADAHPDADQVTRLRVTHAGEPEHAPSAATLADQLTLRAEQTRAELADAGRQRDLAVVQLRAHTDRTIRLFGRVERLSRIPDTIEAWAGKPFIKVTIPDTEQTAVHEQVAAVIDDCLSSGVVPGGRELTMLTLKRVFGVDGLKVSLLKPTDTMEVKRQPVHAFAASDGQKLTAAILLYCTLARLRFDQKGLDPELAGGMLWLDNPFGKATKMDLVDLQRQVASKMGVQLVYLTGVKDYDAVDAFTRRNNLAKALDPVTGHTHVVGSALYRRDQVA